MNEIAAERAEPGPDGARWVLRRDEVTSVLIGASSTAQLEDNMKAIDRPEFTSDELRPSRHFEMTGIGNGVAESMIEKPNYEVGDVVKLKKPHPCGSSEWEILRWGGFPPEMPGLRPSDHGGPQAGGEEHQRFDEKENRIGQKPENLKKK